MRIIAKFQPQVWIDDSVMNVEPQGVDEWDVTDHILSLGKQNALSLMGDDYDTDELRDLPNAPEWIQQWSGPFYVMVMDNIAKYFRQAKEI